VGALAVILPDANIWIYHLDEGLRPEHDRVKPWLSRWIQRSEVLVPAIVETEVIHYLARQLEPGTVRATVKNFLAHPGEVANLDPSTNRDAADLLVSQADRGIGGRDAAILVAAKRHDATVVTHDEALFRVARDWGLDAHDPAAPGGASLGDPSSET
jgi:predicted nucleic acid-binding protein